MEVHILQRGSIPNRNRSSSFWNCSFLYENGILCIGKYQTEIVVYLFDLYKKYREEQVT